MKSRSISPIQVISGWWRLPDQPDTAEGELRLQHDGDSGALLDCSLVFPRQSLFDLPDGDSTGVKAASWRARLPAAYGELSSGRKCTVLSSVGIWGDWHSAGVVFGAHLDATQRVVRGIGADLTNLEPWLGSAADAVLRETASHLIFELSKEKKLIEQETAVGTVQLLYCLPRPNPNAFGLEITPQVRLDITFAEPQSLERAVEHIAGLCSLFSLLSGVEVLTRGALQLELVDGSAAALHPTRSGAPRKDETEQPRVAFLGHVGALPETVRRWYSLSSETRDILCRLSRYYLLERPDAELSFLLACKVAESLARSLDNEGRLSVPTKTPKKAGKVARRDFEDCLKAVFCTITEDSWLSMLAAMHGHQLAYAPAGTDLQELDCLLASVVTAIGPFVTDTVLQTVLNQFLVLAGRAVSNAHLDELLHNIVWTRDELTHLLLDKPKGVGRPFRHVELKSAGNTVAFAATCLALQHLLPVADAAWRSVGEEFCVRQQTVLNRLFG